MTFSDMTLQAMLRMAVRKHGVSLGTLQQMVRDMQRDHLQPALDRGWLSSHRTARGHLYTLTDAGEAWIAHLCLLSDSQPASTFTPP